MKLDKIQRMALMVVLIIGYVLSGIYIREQDKLDVFNKLKNEEKF